MTTSFLVSLVLEGKPCLVLGCDAEAALRARMLHEAGARVRVIGARPGPELDELERDGLARIERRGFEPSDLDDVWLVVLADRDADLLARVGPACEARKLLFCGVDQPGHNSFEHVAVARAGRVSIAVSTAGAAPALAKRLREELERVAAEGELGQFAERLAALRNALPKSQRKARLTALLGGLRLGKLALPNLEED